MATPIRFGPGVMYVARDPTRHMDRDSAGPSPTDRRSAFLPVTTDLCLDLGCLRRFAIWVDHMRPRQQVRQPMARLTKSLPSVKTDFPSIRVAFSCERKLSIPRMLVVRQLLNSVIGTCPYGDRLQRISRSEYEVIFMSGPPSHISWPLQSY